MLTRRFMRKPFKVWKDVYMIGGAELSHSYDCSVYLLDAGDLVLIDAGAEKSSRKLVANIKSLGFDPKKLRAILVTHAHIDHIGSLCDFQETFDVQVIAHKIDAKAIEQGTGVGAEIYGIDYHPCRVDFKIQGSEQILRFGDYELGTIHISGHTPGSIAAYIDMDEKRVLFGQDIHGPYLPEWGADPAKAKRSLQKLINLRADILCEGHYGIYQPATAVERYIRGYLDSL
jgi:glyoxylase-like metal-dependent hydrolase (beta-lactamase superfamily II)